MASKPIFTADRTPGPPAGTAARGPGAGGGPRPGAATTFGSILFEGLDPALRSERREPPACFRDLHLDQVVDRITAGREAYDLKPLFYTPLTDRAAIEYRQEVMRDLEGRGVRRAVGDFAGRMRALRDHLEAAARLDYAHQRNRWFLDAVRVYGEAVERLAEALTGAALRSRGLRAFRAHLAGYRAAAPFRTLIEEAARLDSALAEVRYCLRIRASRITVLPYRCESDYGALIEATFARFRRGAVKDYRSRFPEGPMSHVEGQVLERVARLNPEVFAALAGYRERHAGFLDPGLAAFDREVQFYLAYLEHADTLRRAGLELCYPRVSERDRRLTVRGIFDLALAARHIAEGRGIVPNDLSLEPAERLAVVTGPNQGGKTTFARAIGQIHYLASLGCPVPGSAARLPLCDRILTHFAREEDIETLRGRLLDELVRMRRILEQATPASLIIANEPFASTTLRDATCLSRALARRIARRGALCVWVTFIDALARLDARTVSLVATVDPQDPTRRSYRVERRAADGLAYALALARRHRLTRQQLGERLRR